ncbi:MAG: nucleotidyltransferase [Gemmatimonadota bacterium]|nr:nucleotidyltransferase [Gemmatimonadota bacterium]
MDLYTNFKTVVSALTDANVRFMVAGGVALAFYVEPRMTQGIDLMLPENDWDRVAGLLEPHGYRKLADRMQFKDGTIIDRLTLLDGEDVFLLDFLLVTASLFGRMWNSRETFEYEGQAISVVAPRDLIELKQRRGSSQDKADIERLRSYLDDQG